MDNELVLFNFETLTGEYSDEHWKSVDHLLKIDDLNEECQFVVDALMALAED